MSEQRQNSGVLFKAKEKRSDRSPDYSGTANVDGVEYFMDAWLKDGQAGKFMSFSFKRKERQASGRSSASDRF